MIEYIKNKFMKQKKSIMIGVIIIAFILPMIFIDRKITGKEWFSMQEKYIDNMAELTTSMDNIVALYINGNIGFEDYYNHMQIIRQEMDIILVSYKQEKEGNPVKIGTHTYSTKSGCEAVESSLNEVSSLIDACLMEENYYNLDRLAYTYLAYQRSLSGYLSSYIAAYSVINYGDELKEIMNISMEGEGINE